MEEEEEGKEIRGSGDKRTDIKEDNLEVHQEISGFSALREILAQILVSSAQGGGEDTDKKCGDDPSKSQRRGSGIVRSRPFEQVPYQ